MGGWGMRERREIDSTLGDLIAAVFDVVNRSAHHTANADVLVSYILNDLIASQRVRLKNRSAVKTT
jgi:hypothetical protein